VKEYYIWFLVLQTGMLGVFMALDFFLFFVFWEAMLVPMYLLIGIWGGPRKLYAAIKFFLYTLLGSVAMLLAVLFLYFYNYRQTGVYTFSIEALYKTAPHIFHDPAYGATFAILLFLAFFTLGIFALNPAGLSGSVLQQINHGISTGALFLIVGILYERRHTREISEYGGISNVMPVYATITMIMFLSSMGLPLLNGFVG